MKIISINQLIDEQKYLTLKTDFLLRDEKHRTHLRNMNPEDPYPLVNLTIDVISFEREKFLDSTDDLGISYHESDGSFITVTENFYDDYLHPKIKSMCNNYIMHIKKEFEEKDILNPAEIKFFGEKKTQILHSLVSNAESAKHLNSATKELITSVFNEIIDFVYENYINDPDVEKIDFNLNKNQVVVFFNLLVTQNIIQNTNISHFNGMLQKFFRYKDGKEFKDINKAYKTYSELKDGKSSKNSIPTLESLEKIFNHRDFFNSL